MDKKTKTSRLDQQQADVENLQELFSHDRMPTFNVQQ